MTNFKWFASFVLAATMVSTLSAETHCPGNVASVPFRLVNRHQMIVAVSVNHSGPYNFLLDTGTQITMVDPSLAASLHLATQGTAEVASVGMHASASFAQLDLLEAGSHSVTNQKVLVYDLKNLQATGLDIQGVLGEDFLEQFDMLIDNAHRLLCLDESGTMRADVKGPRRTVRSRLRQRMTRVAQPLIVVARLSDGRRPVRLKLDSGTNVSFLYNTVNTWRLDCSAVHRCTGAQVDRNGRLWRCRRRTSGSAQLKCQKVPFATLVGAQKDSRTSNFDGLLTMGLFRQIFIDHADHFAVLQPW